jgi:hypothetical protein
MGCHDLGDGTPDHPIGARDLQPEGVDWWPKAMPPLWQYLLRLLRRQTSASSPPKGIDPAPSGLWLNHGNRGNQEGA